MTKKPTAAETRVKTHAKRGEGFPRPKFSDKQIGIIVGKSVVADTLGDLYQVDANDGTVRALRWE